MNKPKQAFTLVELIVVITILAILGTIAFLSLSGYLKDSRNSVRFNDLKLIESSLELYSQKTGFYPESTLPVTITFANAEAWTQGTFGEDTFGSVGKLDHLPLDPLTGTEYTYSLLNTKGEYELAAALEGIVANNSTKLINKTYAGTLEGTSLVLGTYNGNMLSVNTGGLDYVLAVPTIISGDITLLSVDEISFYNKMAYNGSRVVAGKYVNTEFDTSKTFDYNLTALELIVFTGSIDDLKIDESKRVTLLENLQKAYSGTVIENGTDYETITSELIDTNNPADTSKTLAKTVIYNAFKLDFKDSNTSTSINVPLGTIPGDLRDLFGDNSDYTSNWSSNTCVPSSMTVVDILPGTDTLPEDLLDNTIYSLTTGDYVLSYASGSNMGNCTAIIGNLESKIYTSNLISVFGIGLINVVSNTNNIIYGLKIDGYRDGLGGNHGNFNRNGIYLDDSSNSTFVKLKLYNSRSGLYFVNGSYNLSQDIIAYNGSQGLTGYGLDNIIINNMYTYNNNEAGIGFSGENITFNNVQSHNIEQTFRGGGINVLINNGFSYTHSDSIYNNKISGTGVILNDFYMSKGPRGIDINTSRPDIKYYGVYKEKEVAIHVITKLVAGVDGFLGFSNGTIDTTGTFGINDVTIPSIPGWNYTTIGNNCVSGFNFVGCAAFTLTSIPNGNETYTYGSNIPNQTQPARWNGTNFELYGTDGVDYNSTKKIGEW